MRWWKLTFSTKKSNKKKSNFRPKKYGIFFDLNFFLDNYFFSIKFLFFWWKSTCSDFRFLWSDRNHFPLRSFWSEKKNSEDFFFDNDNTAQMLILAHFSTYHDQRSAKNQNQDFLKYTTARYIHLLKHLEVSTTGLNYNSQTNKT